ncbi:MAG: hypothetical protein IJT43_02695 [Stomatobaculum sp.]|nr:hypothetical protein [Stomatobaculum sp.]
MMIDRLRKVSDGKNIIVSETGWPTEGGAVGKAKAGEREAHEYFTAIKAWSLSHGTQVLWFEAADEPWKRAGENEAGAHWGILSTAFTVKDCFNSTDFFQTAR